MLHEFVPQFFMGEDDGGAAGGGENTEKMPELYAQATSEQQADKSLWVHKKLPELITAYQTARASVPIVPEGPDKYELSQTLPEGMAADEATDKAFREGMHKAKLTNGQGKDIQGLFHGLMSNMMKGAKEKQAEKIETARKALDGSLGKAGIATAEKAIREYGGEDLLKLTKDRPDQYGAFITAFSEVGKRISEDTIVPGEGGGDDNTKLNFKELFPDMYDANGRRK